MLRQWVTWVVNDHKGIVPANLSNLSDNREVGDVFDVFLALNLDVEEVFQEKDESRDQHAND